MSSPGGSTFSPGEQRRKFASLSACAAAAILLKSGPFFRAGQSHFFLRKAGDRMPPGAFLCLRAAKNRPCGPFFQFALRRRILAARRSQSERKDFLERLPPAGPLRERVASDDSGLTDCMEREMGRDAHFFLISAERGALIPEDDSGVSGGPFRMFEGFVNQ